MKRFLVGLLSAAILCLVSTSVYAATSVSWTAPPDGSSYPVGTIVNPTGEASGVGSTGGGGLDLALVIDVSGSMSGSGLASAKTAATALVNSLPQNTTSVAIIAFNSSANTTQVLTPLNPNKAAVIAAINSLSAGGGTQIGSGIVAATTELTSVRHTAGRTMMQVVLSDGFSGNSPSMTGSATTAAAAGITVHTVGIPGHNSAQMQAIATAGGGIYTNATSLTQLINLFNGTGGNLVGLDHVDITLPDGTILSSIATDALGNFTLPDWVIQNGSQTFKAVAYGTDGTMASAFLTLNGTDAPPIPEPSTYMLMGIGLAGLAWVRRRNKA